MSAVIFACVVMVVLTTLIHFEFLSLLNSRLPRVSMQRRRKLLVVIMFLMIAHVIEIAVYGLAFFVLISLLGIGDLAGVGAGLRSHRGAV